MKGRAAYHTMCVQMIMTAGTAIAKLEQVAQKTAKAAFANITIVTVLNPTFIGFFIALVPHLIAQTAPLVSQCTLMLLTSVFMGL